MFTQLQAIMKKPAPYEKGTIALWTDPHISKGMLEAHLHPTWDAATRPHVTVRENVKWISTVAPVEKHPNLLDLGCGPGIYAEEFFNAGYNVTGVDFSARSIDYARNSAKEKGLPIAYHCQDYLTLDFTQQFDLITLINYDFGVLSTDDRAKLLMKICTALKPNGLLILDVFTPHKNAGQKECKDWEYAEKGFVCAEPHVCLNTTYWYDENISCSQHIVITEQDIGHINIWEHTFTKDELSQDLSTAGLSIKALYENMTGADYYDNSKEMCVVAQNHSAV